MRKLVATLLLVLALLAIAPTGIRAIEQPQQVGPDACSLCGYIPLWCWLCYMQQWWDTGCYPGDPDCLDW
jgi:hypothetical protein